MSFNVAKAVQSRVVLLSGNEPVLLRAAIDDMLEHAGLQKDDYDLEEFQADSSQPGDWLASVGTFPFLASKRTVIVRNAQKLKADDIPTAPLQALPETALLILVHSNEGEDQRQAGGSRKASLERLVTSAGGTVAKFDADPKKTSDMLRQEILKRGRKIQPGTLDLLVEMTGGSYSYAMEELDKVFLYSEEETISEHSIKSVVVASREWNVWRMIDALTSGNVQESLRQLQIVVGSKNKVEDVVFSQLFPLISRQLKLLYQGRVCVESGCRPESAPSEVRAQFPSKPNLGSERPFVQGSVMRAAQNLSLGQVVEAMEHLSKADAALKGLGTSLSPMDTIERLVFDLSNTLRAKRA
ncbi:MAG: DNA polymerase III subunit delta [Armatimonadetes bacterium]|nr:DNA polymerase III subunit delta [Armatimonadota bacterium]